VGPLTALERTVLNWQALPTFINRESSSFFTVDQFSSPFYSLFIFYLYFYLSTSSPLPNERLLTTLKGTPLDTPVDLRKKKRAIVLNGIIIYLLKPLVLETWAGSF
jgi:hypothetical protein